MHSTVQPALALTVREREILSCILQGHTTAEMSRQLGVRQTTARTHVRNLLLKLGVSSRLEAAAVATATWSGSGFSGSLPGPGPAGSGAGDAVLAGGLAGRLTDRESDVLRGLLQGLTRKAIAEQLRVAPNTVRAHVSNITRKLGCPSALTAVAQVRSCSDRTTPAGAAQVDATGAGWSRTASVRVVAAPISARWEKA